MGSRADLGRFQATLPSRVVARRIGAVCFLDSSVSFSQGIEGIRNIALAKLESLFAKHPT